MEQVLIGNREQLRHILSPECIGGDEDHELSRIIQLLNENNDSFSSVENQDNYNITDGPVGQLRNYISEEVEKKKEHIQEFIRFFTRLSDNKREKINKFLINIRAWKERGENIYMKKKVKILICLSTIFFVSAEKGLF